MKKIISIGLFALLSLGFTACDKKEKQHNQVSENQLTNSDKKEKQHNQVSENQLTNKEYFKLGLYKGIAQLNSKEGREEFNKQLSIPPEGMKEDEVFVYSYLIDVNFIEDKEIVRYMYKMNEEYNNITKEQQNYFVDDYYKSSISSICNSKEIKEGWNFFPELKYQSVFLDTEDKLLLEQTISLNDCVFFNAKNTNK